MDQLLTRTGANRVRLGPEMARGHYESYFHRANHPSEPRAFWIRYTVFCPTGRPEAALGECWAVYFDGPAKQIVAAKDAVPLAECEFEDLESGLSIAEARLDPAGLRGRAMGPDGVVGWDLATHGGDSPPGGTKTCLNSKIAECELEVWRPGRATLQLSTRHRAAFEILTDDDAHQLQTRL